MSRRSLGAGGPTTTPRHTLELRTLGRATLCRDGAEAEDIVHQSKRFALLVYLAVAAPGGFHRRDTILSLFWPDLSEKRARNALNKALHFLRFHLGSEVVESRGSVEVGLKADSVWCDAVAYQEAYEGGRLGEAVELYGGPFLEGFHVSEAAEFEHWVDRQREHFEQRYSAALQELALAAADRNDL